MVFLSCVVMVTGELCAVVCSLLFRGVVGVVTAVFLFGVVDLCVTAVVVLLLCLGDTNVWSEVELIV